MWITCHWTILCLSTQGAQYNKSIGFLIFLIFFIKCIFSCFSLLFLRLIKNYSSFDQRYRETFWNSWTSFRFDDLDKSIIIIKREQKEADPFTVEMELVNLSQFSSSSHAISHCAFELFRDRIFSDRNYRRASLLEEHSFDEPDLSPFSIVNYLSLSRERSLQAYFKYQRRRFSRYVLKIWIKEKRNDLSDCIN